MPTDSYLDPSIQHSSPINWPLIILLFSCILALILLITVFFIIPYEAEKYLGTKIQGEINNLTYIDYSCSFDIYDCTNFTTTLQAQIIYDYCKQKGMGDVHKLDSNENGQVCEDLI